MIFGTKNPKLSSPVLHPVSQEMCYGLGRHLVGMGSSASASINYANANRALILPFELLADFYVRNAILNMGTTRTVDVGIYDESYQRIVSSGGGSIATGGVKVALGPAKLKPGFYYVAVSSNASHTNGFSGYTITNYQMWQFGQRYADGSYYPLPADLSGAAWTDDANAVLLDIVLSQVTNL